MGSTASKHPNTITLPHCWVCGSRFTDVNPPGKENREEHHIIPQAAGGTDGPTVSLCDKHHTALHKIAVHLKSGRPYFVFLQGEPQQAQQKIMWLATQAFNAFEATRNDPNKRAMVLMTLDRKQQVMIEKLRKVYPAAKGREALLDLALTSLYNRHFLPDD
jgi:hypothetical protein